MKDNKHSKEYNIRDFFYDLAGVILILICGYNVEDSEFLANLIGFIGFWIIMKKHY